MTAPDPQPPKVAPRVTGVAHIFAATGYSLAGARRMWRETAFRHEVLAFALSIVVLVVVGATFVELAILIGLFALVGAVEALNTAIECIVDHVSPDWSVAARDAKDIGSFAVMCSLIIAGLFVVVTVARHLLGV